MASLICPLCKHPLDRGEKIWRCDKGHSFDVAREGYVNLLPVQHKSSRDPGDDPRMVSARRDFLQAGHYQPLRDELVRRLASLQPMDVLDIGCGEGYYGSAFTELASEVVGLDISRAAIRLAAKRFPQVTWVVGSGAMLPLRDSSVDVACNIFTQLHVDEMQRVLKPGGHVLLVTPASEHLLSIREQLFDSVRDYDAGKFLAGFQGRFTVELQQQLNFSLKLAQPALRQLLQMTPYAWRARQERRLALEENEVFATQAAFAVTLLRKG